jgi:hypothetical protein
MRLNTFADSTAPQANSDTMQSIIWAYGNTKPSSADSGARIAEHVSQGRMTLNLAKNSSSDSNTSTGSDQVPSSTNERALLAHAVLTCIGFLILLPIGALIPRYLRTFVSGWFLYHWIFQFALGMSLPLLVMCPTLTGLLGRQ